MTYVTLLKKDQGWTAHTRSRLLCCVERPGVEWPIASELRLGEVREVLTHNQASYSYNNSQLFGEIMV